MWCVGCELLERVSPHFLTMSSSSNCRTCSLSLCTIENMSPRTTSRVRSASLARRTVTAGILAEAARNEDWVLAEQRKRMSVDDVRNLNKRLSAHYFHNMTNHVEFISTSIEAILRQDASAAGNQLKTTTNTENREALLTDLLLSTAKIMQGKYIIVCSSECACLCV